MLKDDQAKYLIIFIEKEIKYLIVKNYMYLHCQKTIKLNEVEPFSFFLFHSE